MLALHLMPVVFVSDVPRAVRFYQEALGLSLRDGAEMAPDTVWAELDCGGATLALHHAEEAPAGDGRVELDFTVPDAEVDGLVAKVKRAGAGIVDEVQDIGFGRTFSFRDPDGLLVRISAQPD